MGEELFYHQGNVEISKTLARFGGVTYPINGIGSVLIVPPNRTGAIVLAVMAAAIFVVSLNNNNSGLGIGAVVVGLVAAALAFRMPFKLVLRTASGDQQATVGDIATLSAIKAGIERAVIARG